MVLAMQRKFYTIWRENPDSFWLFARGGQVGENPVEVGPVLGDTVQICRDLHRKIPGYLHEGRCWLTFERKTPADYNYEVLDLAPDTYKWVKYDNAIPFGALASGAEEGYITQYVCLGKVQYKGKTEYRPGKFLSRRAHLGCIVPMASGPTAIQGFQLLVIKN